MSGHDIDDENVRIGTLLQEARESQGVLQSEMTEATGLTKNHISAVERGLNKASTKMLLGYCRKLHMTPNEILGYKDENGILPELRTILGKMDEDDQKRVIEMIKLMN